MSNIEAEIAAIKTDIKYILEAVKSLEKRFAAKWTEGFLKSVIGSILLYFMAGVLGLFKMPAFAAGLNNLI